MKEFRTLETLLEDASENLAVITPILPVSPVLKLLDFNASGNANHGQLIDAVAKMIGLDGIELQTMMIRLVRSKNETGISLLRDFALHAKMSYAGDAIMKERDTIEKINHERRCCHKSRLVHYDEKMAEYEEKKKEYDKRAAEATDSDLDAIITEIKNIISSMDFNVPKERHYAFLYHLKRCSKSSALRMQERNWYHLAMWVQSINVDELVREAFAKRPRSILDLVANTRNGNISYSLDWKKAP